jgi:hypothetical protein
MCSKNGVDGGIPGTSLFSWLIRRIIIFLPPLLTYKIFSFSTSVAVSSSITAQLFSLTTMRLPSISVLKKGPRILVYLRFEEGSPGSLVANA